MDKRIAQLLAFVGKTGDRLVILPETGDPFVLMDFAQYQELHKQPAGLDRRSIATSSKQNEPELVALEPASAPTSEEKYYFEPVESEGSQQETTK